MKYNINYKLYLVTDRNILIEKSLETAVAEAIEGGVKIVQLREKDISSLEFYKTALKLKEITTQYNIPLIINDRLDIALAVDAEGVHLGQRDLPCSIAREIIGENKIIGVSAATVEEAKKAEVDGADYIGVGALFPTNTKQNTRAVSIERLTEIKKSVSIPVVAIGGINESNVYLLKSTNIDGIAVVSAILGKKDIQSAAMNLLCKI
ncbi:thiamine phosphate synthase [Defluviitalea saccharophila]|uniref:Thiamine-phosphate synthase n=1 Tax=Defluviitalea saccharophila TaxID=879970 RepID=A0ABZ2Y946_9FIRM